jgi:hypothetical protein
VSIVWLTSNNLRRSPLPISSAILLQMKFAASLRSPQIPGPVEHVHRDLRRLLKKFFVGHIRETVTALGSSLSYFR